MLVSVIIPNYNHADYLVQRIESVLSQTYENFELILLDDCSADNSREILQRYRNHPRVSHLVLNEKNSGIPFKQWVRGFALAKGEFIWIAESDDYAAPDFLAKCVARLTTSGCDFVHTDSMIVDENGMGTALYSKRRNDFFNINHWSSDHETSPDRTILDYLLYRCIVNNASSTLFRKKLTEGLDLQKLVTYKNAGDLYFYVHVLSKTSCCYVAQPLNFFRYHGKSITIKNTGKGLVKKETFEILMEFILNYSVQNMAQRAKLKTALKFVLLYFGKATLKEMSMTSLIALLYKPVMAGLLSIKDALYLSFHIQYEKLGIRGIDFLSKSVLRTDAWRRINVET